MGVSKETSTENVPNGRIDKSSFYYENTITTEPRDNNCVFVYNFYYNKQINFILGNIMYISFRQLNFMIRTKK